MPNVRRANGQKGAFYGSTRAMINLRIRPQNVSKSSHASHTREWNETQRFWQLMRDNPTFARQMRGIATLQALHRGNPDPGFWKALGAVGPQRLLQIARTIERQAREARNKQRIREAAAALNSDPPTAGLCGSYTLGLVAAGQGGGCLVTTPSDTGFVFTLGAGMSTAGGAADLQIFNSNAERLSDLEGRSMCFSASVGTPLPGPTAGGTLCGGLDSAGDFNGIVSIQGGGGVGLMPGASAAAIYGDTTTVVLIDRGFDIPRPPTMVCGPACWPF